MEYDSKSVGDTRKMMVYLPPGYSKDTKYPVLYLLHGAGDNEGGWTRTGSANLILDNLFADKKIVPMIVVMPNGSPQGPRPGTVLAGTIMKRADADKNGIVSRKSSSPPPRRSTRRSILANWTRNSSRPASIVSASLRRSGWPRRGLGDFQRL